MCMSKELRILSKKIKTHFDIVPGGYFHFRTLSRSITLLKSLPLSYDEISNSGGFKVFIKYQLTT